MDRAGRETWAKRVERWKDSGLSAEQFAQETGINPRSLRWWKWQLGSKPTTTRDVVAATPEKAATSSTTRARRRRHEPPAVTFIEVPPTAVTSSAAIEIVLSARLQVRVPSGFDDDTLTRVLDVLERRA